MNFFNFLADSAASSVTSANDAATRGGMGNWTLYIMIGVVVVLMVVYFIFSSRRRKKQEAEIDQMMSALVPGDKILTIGRWHGEIVEVLEDGKFVVKTGSDNYPGYVTIDKAAIAHIFKQQDESVETADAAPSDTSDTDEVFDGPADGDSGEAPAADNENEKTE